MILIELIPEVNKVNFYLKEYYNSYLIKNYQVSHDTINKIGRNYDFSLDYSIFKTIQSLSINYKLLITNFM